MIIVQTPLRISFAGGGTDFKDFWKKETGAVLSTAIDKYIYVIINERFDDKIVINYSKKEIVNSVNEIKHDLVREAMKLTGVDCGIEITTQADIPSQGSGLGSSSSVTVGLLHALHTYNGNLVTADLLSKQACKIEIDILGSPIGIQDQYIAAYGGMKNLVFHKNGNVDANPIEVSYKKLRRFSENLLLFYIGNTRKAANILKEQKSKIQNKTKILCEMRDQAYQIKKALIKNDFNEVGLIMRKGWELKKTLANKITNPGINDMYKEAISSGCIGAKVVGAGGGGFMLMYVPLENQNKLRRAMSHKREFPIQLERDGSKIILNTRRFTNK
jgi:D-glycero-alpha-D-manno-heptose-7-phosphate kinase